MRKLGEIVFWCAATSFCAILALRGFELIAEHVK